MPIIQQGWNQFTAAAMNDIRRAVGSRTRSTTRRRRKSTKTSMKRKSTSRRTKGKRASLVKGSAAAKAWGKKMKALRKK